MRVLDKWIPANGGGRVVMVSYFSISDFQHFSFY
jgi:hypothetical protein